MGENEISFEELKLALAVLREAESLSIPLEKIPELIRAAKRMAEDEGFLEAAVRLADLERRSGKRYEELESALQELGSQIGERERRLEALKQDIERLERRRKQLLEEAREIERRRREERERFEEESSGYRDRLRALRRQLDRELRRQKVIRSELEEFVKLKSEYKNTPDLREKMENLLQEADTLVEAKRKLQKEVAELEKQYSRLCQDIDLLISLKRKVETGTQNPPETE